MISPLQQQQLEKYVNAFQAATKEGAAPHELHILLPEFYHFVGGCKTQVEKALQQTQNFQEEELRVAEGLLENLNTLHSSLLETSQQLGIILNTSAQTLTADHKTQEIRVNFTQCNQDSLKNIILQAIRDTLNMEAPLANAGYTVDIEPDHSIVIRVIHQEKE